MLSSAMRRSDYILQYPAEVNALPFPEKAIRLLRASTWFDALLVFVSGLSKIVVCSHIPEGTAVRVHFWSLHRDDRNFTHAETFWPDRWLIAEGLEPRTKDVCARSASSSPMIARGKGEFKHDPNAFIPFSFGPYNCVGKNLALQEMRILVCQVLQKLRFRFADGWDPMEWDGTFGDKFVAEVGMLPIVIELRQ